MSAGDTARTMYQSARHEAIQRATLRDNVLLVYLAAIGTIFGIALGTTATTDILLVIPYIALGVAVIISQHNAVIGSLGLFCVNELEPFLRTLSPSEYAPQWENSDALRMYSSEFLRLRSFGHIITISAPCIAALSMTGKHAIYSSFPMGVVWWLAAASLVIAAWQIVKVHSWREDLYRRYLRRGETRAHSGPQQ